MHAPELPRALRAVSISLYYSGSHASVLDYTRTWSSACHIEKQDHPIIRIIVI